MQLCKYIHLLIQSFMNLGVGGWRCSCSREENKKKQNNNNSNKILCATADKVVRKEIIFLTFNFCERRAVQL